MRDHRDLRMSRKTMTVLRSEGSTTLRLYTRTFRVSSHREPPRITQIQLGQSPLLMTPSARSAQQTRRRGARHVRHRWCRSHGLRSWTLPHEPEPYDPVSTPRAVVGAGGEARVQRRVAIRTAPERAVVGSRARAAHPRLRTNRRLRLRSRSNGVSMPQEPTRESRRRLNQEPPKTAYSTKRLPLPFTGTSGRPAGPQGRCEASYSPEGGSLAPGRPRSGYSESCHEP